jgi:mono/diheme cytochrome c family protein
MVGAVTAIVLVLAVALAVAAPDGGAANKPALKQGKVLFVAACGSCHTLAAAKTKGRKGPNLAHESGSYSELVAQIRRGGEGMPAFGKTLTKIQIARIAAFVVASTSRHGAGADD